MIRLKIVFVRAFFSKHIFYIFWKKEKKEAASIIKIETASKAIHCGKAMLSQL